MMYKLIGSDKREYGPVTTEKLREWIADSRANGKTQVQAEGESAWKPMSEVPEFAEALAARAEQRRREPPPPARPPREPREPREPRPNRPARPAPPEGRRREFAPQGNRPRAGGPQGAGPQGGAPSAPAPQAPVPVRLDIEHCFERSWAMLQEHFWLVVGTCLVALLIEGAVPLLSGVVRGGLFYFLMRLARRQKVEFGDGFSGFTLAFVPLFLCGLVKMVLVPLGLVLLLVPGIYLWVVWSFALPLIMDRRMTFWQAMELSRKTVQQVWWPVFGLNLACLLVSVAGLLLCVVGIYVTIPLAFGALVFAYEDLFRARRGA